MSILGTWQGKYRYDDPTTGRETSFSIEIGEDKAGRFRGMVQDGPGGHPMPGKVSGAVSGEQLRFVKEMPATLLVFPDGHWQTLAGRTQRIAYEGRSDGPNTFHGVWTMRGGLRLIGGRLYICRTTHGSWHMSRS